MNTTTTWIFMRHFEKGPHEMHPLGKLLPKFLKESPEQIESYVRKWYHYDREEVVVSDEGRQAGRARAAELKAKLSARNIPVHHIISSPFRRTRTTANIVWTYFHLATLSEDERLCELNQGVRCGASFDEVREHYPEYREQALVNYATATPPHGESHAEMRDGRVRSFLNDLGKYHAGGIVVSHAGVIEAVRQLMFGVPDSEVVDRFAKNTCLNYGEYLMCVLDRSTMTWLPVMDLESFLEPSS